MSLTNIFAPVSTPAESIFGLSIFVFSIMALISGVRPAVDLQRHYAHLASLSYRTPLPLRPSGVCFCQPESV
jgi:hypothetical protein